MLLAPIWLRLLVAGIAVGAIWAAVLIVLPSTPSLAPAQPPVRVAAPALAVPAAESGALRTVVRSGMPAPGGGRFDRFDVAGQPVVAPVNERGEVAFYATVLRGPAREGIYLAAGPEVRKVAAIGDAVPSGGTIAEVGAHPLPALNAAGHVAFVAQIAGGRGTEGVFLAAEGGLHTIAISGEDAPGIPAAVLVGFDAPTLNDNDELAFVATVRRVRDTLDVLYFWNGRRLQRVVAEGDRLPRIGGTINKIGGPALNNAGVIVFPAAIVKGPALGGVFVAGARDLRLLAGAGDRTPSGAMLLRFSERLAIDDAGRVTFAAHLRAEGKGREAVLRIGPEGPSEIAVEGNAAPGGGRYAGVGPWPTIAPDGFMAFIAALDDGPGPLAVFAGNDDDIQRVATSGERPPQGEALSRFATNTVAAAGPGGRVTFATAAQAEGEISAIYCRCPNGLR